MFSEPRACLPLFCTRLLDMFPTEHNFLHGAGAVIETWLQGCFTSIDFSERAHAQFRRDIASPTSGGNFAASVDRLLVRQWTASHISRGLGCNGVMFRKRSYRCVPHASRFPAQAHTLRQCAPPILNRRAPCTTTSHDQCTHTVAIGHFSLRVMGWGGRCAIDFDVRRLRQQHCCIGWRQMF